MSRLGRPSFPGGGRPSVTPVGVSPTHGRLPVPGDGLSSDPFLFAWGSKRLRASSCGMSSGEGRAGRYLTPPPTPVLRPAGRLRFYSSPAIAIHCHSAPPQGS